MQKLTIFSALSWADSLRAPGLAFLNLLWWQRLKHPNLHPQSFVREHLIFNFLDTISFCSHELYEVSHSNVWLYWKSWCSHLNVSQSIWRKFQGINSCLIMQVRKHAIDSSPSIMTPGHDKLLKATPFCSRVQWQLQMISSDGEAVLLLRRVAIPMNILVCYAIDSSAVGQRSQNSNLKGLFHHWIVVMTIC